MDRSQRARRGRIAVEIACLAVVYESYDLLRDKVIGPTSAAFRNAKDVIHLERLLGLYHEESIQTLFLPYHVFISFWNIYYGTVHFVMPLVALVWLFRNNPERYVLWRNTLGCMLVIGLLGFWLYPLMPPRLLPHHYGFVDTPVKFFGFGKPAKGNSIKEYGNIYAAMPSLHIGWSSWAAFALFPMVRRRWGRVLLVAYPCVTTFAIVVTGNHYLLDAVGGLAVLGLGYAIARPLTVAMARRGWTFSAARKPRPGHMEPAALEAGAA